ncbi:MAG: FeoA family protein [Elusimicrobiota bacterium]
MTLESIPLAQAARVVGFRGLDEIDKIQLNGLGLRPGVLVTKILRTPLGDPIECLVGSQLLAIESRLLPHIRVEAL